MIVDDIRNQAAWVAARAEKVKINHDKIAAYTRRILDENPIITEMDPVMHHASVAYVFALDSINFGSGWFYPGFDYKDIAQGLKNAFLLEEMNTPEKWESATPEQMHEICAAPQSLNDLMTLFARHLNTTGAMLNVFYDGDPLALLEECQGSAARLVETLSTWPSFRDVAVYKGETIPFFKGAQILAADIHLVLGGRGYGNFQDMDKLTIFADNMVPHVLRCDGILNYDESLASRIDTGAGLEKDSEDEIELRAAAIHVVELMRASTGGDITSVNLDHLLWNRGYSQNFDAGAKKPHRVKTTCY